MMNPRITELAEQAFQSINDISTEGVADYHTFEQAWFQVYNQKFAELIVIKTTDLVQQLGAINADNPDVSWTCSTLIKIIEQYWGMCEPA